MSPVIGNQDEFENRYTHEFRRIAAPYAEFLRYERDRAALDLGLHLKRAIRSGDRGLSTARIWVQLKGIRSSTLDLERLAGAVDVPLDLKIDHLRFWYASPEAVYLVVYLECADMFLAEDIGDIIDRQWGERILDDQTFRPAQKTATVRVRKTAVLDERTWERMFSHRALRIDGPLFRGRPLGHRLDPLRCIPNELDPPAFSDVVGALLDVHGFRRTKALDATGLFPTLESSGDIVSLSLGRMYYTYEWQPQLFTEFGFGPDDDFQIEGEVIHVQGPCAVLVHSKVVSYPDRDALNALAQRLVTEEDTARLLVFANVGSDDRYFGSFFGGVRGTGLHCIPQLLGDLAFNLLTATTVYLEFRDKITWRFVNYLPR